MLVINLRKCLLWLSVVLFVALSIGIGVKRAYSHTPPAEYVIVIDAGHGGRDDGCSGIGGLKESEVNLAIAKKLREYLVTLGLKVVMTRNDAGGLYSADAENYKKSDMAKRIEIIEKAKPHMVISIHANSYSDSSQYGAQAFFQENDARSQKFAETMQEELINILGSPRSEAIKGDYYILKESRLPAILVECGYLSNANEESLLGSEEYRSKVAYAISCGVIKYFGVCQDD